MPRKPSPRVTCRHCEKPDVHFAHEMLCGKNPDRYMSGKERYARGRGGTCPRCLIRMPTHKGYCYGCYLEKAKERYYANLDYNQTRNRNAFRDLKDRGIALYGGKCRCCEENHFQFLHLDHVHNDGTYERKVLGLQTASIYRHSLREGAPDPHYQLLCANCNLAKYRYGVCPHETERQTNGAIQVISAPSVG